MHVPVTVEYGFHSLIQVLTLVSRKCSLLFMSKRAFHIFEIIIIEEEEEGKFMNVTQIVFSLHLYGKYLPNQLVLMPYPLQEISYLFFFRLHTFIFINEKIISKIKSFIIFLQIYTIFNIHLNMYDNYLFFHKIL